MPGTREWKDHKYTAKVKTKNGNIRYIYGDNNSRNKTLAGTLAKNDMEEIGRDVVDYLLANPLDPYGQAVKDVKVNRIGRNVASAAEHIKDYMEYSVKDYIDRVTY